MLTRYADKPFTKDAEIVSLDKVIQHDIEWLWPNHIPLGMLTLIAGDPGVGKSFLTLYLAAAVSAGLPWPRSAVETPQSFPKEKFAKQIYCGATPAESGVECPVLIPPLASSKRPVRHSFRGCVAIIKGGGIGFCQPICYMRRSNR